MSYSYDDEDNRPMSYSVLAGLEDEHGHNPTIYHTRAEMKADEQGLPFDDPRPDDGCWNCFNFDWKREACTAGWNNLDESYYNPDTDKRELTDYCENHDRDDSVDPKEVFDYDNGTP